MNAAGETAAFLETNYAGNGVAAMRTAREWGYRTRFMTADLAQYEGLADHPAGVADAVSVVDTYDVTKLLSVAADLRIVAALAFDDYRIVQSALLAEYLELDAGPPVRGVVNARFKGLMRARLAASSHAVRFRTYALGADPVEVARDVEQGIGLPCVVKPNDGSGSVAVRYCESAEDVVEALRYLEEVSSALGPPGFRLGAALVEEPLAGDEYSAELTWSDGRWRLIGIARSILSPPPSSVEMGHVYPAQLSEEVACRVAEQLCEALGLLGLARTVAHVEFRLDGGVARIIEVNPRPPGGRVRDLLRLAHGYDVITEQYLAAHLAPRPVPARPLSPPGRVAAVRFYLPDRMLSPGFEVELPRERDPRIVESGRLPVAPSTRSEPDNDARAAYAIAVGDSADELDPLLRDYISNVGERA